MIVHLARLARRSLLIGIFSFLVSAFAQFGLNEEVVRGELSWSATGVHPGGSILAAVELQIQSPFHINSNHPKPGFIPTRIETSLLPRGIVQSTPVFPEPRVIEFGPASAKEKLAVYSDRLVVFIPMAVPTDLSPGNYPLEIVVHYQACNDTLCFAPTSTTMRGELAVAPTSRETKPANAALFAEYDSARDRLELPFFGWDISIRPSNLALLLAVAALGGFLLNLTPCVLPLIPIKIMGLAKASTGRLGSLRLGLALACGVVAFWLALAGALVGVSGFTSTNKLFQYPAFTLGVGVLIWLMAAGMCGLFAVRLPQWIYRFNPSQDSLVGSFLFGIMTAVLSTPCTAPFMGGAIAWSVTQSSVVTFATFAAIGAGMASPYLVLAAFPALTRAMPRSGAAGDLIKQVMGLLMFAAGTYFFGTGLAGVLSVPPDPPTDRYWWAVGGLVIVAGGWLAWRVLRIARRTAPRVIFCGLGLALVLAGALLGTLLTQKSPIQWVYYSPERLAQAQAQAKVVALEFTAAWCINCLVLERTVLHDERVVRALNADGVTAMKVDLTGNNTLGSQKLVEVGSRSIPLLVIYSSEGREIFRSDAYTVEQVLAALGQ